MAAAPQVGERGILVDASVLASILNQARGPTLDRIHRQLSPFAGDGNIGIAQWLAAYERLCGVERIAPTELLTYLLTGSAAQV